MANNFIQKNPGWSGYCYYSGNGTFTVMVFTREYDDERERVVRQRAILSDQRVVELARQAFELMVSADDVRRIGDFMVSRVETPKGLPQVSMDIGGSVMTITQSRNGTGSGRFEWAGPFSYVSESIEEEETESRINHETTE